MELAEALEIVVARTGHERYRTLVRDRPDYAALVLALAEGRDPAAALAREADRAAVLARRASKPRGPLGTTPKTGGG